jgi:hypothetical protein
MPTVPLVTTVPPPPRHERTRQVAVRLSVVALAVPVLLFTGSTRVVASGLHPGANPRANVAPSPNFEYTGSCSGAPGAWHCANPCVTATLTFPAHTDAPSCDAFVLKALDAARAGEHLAAMVLPTNWRSLSDPERLFVLADLERTARGLPPYLGLNARLSAAAQRAANADTDPTPAPGFSIAHDASGVTRVGGTWASGMTTLGSDFIWMYADGWGGSLASTPNTACTSRGASGCWAHRDALLGSDRVSRASVGLGCASCEMGTGFSVRGGTGSYVDLLERPAHGAPAMTFTWARDVLPYLAQATTRQRAEERDQVAARRAAVHGAWPQWNARGDAATPCLTPSVESPTGMTTCRAKTFKRTGR